MSEFGIFWYVALPLVCPALPSLAVIPVLLVFVFFQKQIVEGVVLTGMKG